MSEVYILSQEKQRKWGLELLGVCRVHLMGKPGEEMVVLLCR